MHILKNPEFEQSVYFGGLNPSPGGEAALASVSASPGAFVELLTIDTDRPVLLSQGEARLLANALAVAAYVAEGDQ